LETWSVVEGREGESSRLKKRGDGHESKNRREEGEETETKAADQSAESVSEKIRVKAKVELRHTIALRRPFGLLR